MCAHSNADAVCFVQVQSVTGVQTVRAASRQRGWPDQNGIQLKAVRDLVFTCRVTNCQMGDFELKGRPMPE